MCDRLKIVVVDDEEPIQISVNLLIQPLMKAFPNSEKVELKTLADLLIHLELIPPPDIVILDLKLLDSTLEGTLTQLQNIKEKAPVVIITGFEVHYIRQILEGRHHEIQIIQKNDLTPNLLIRVITNAVALFASSTNKLQSRNRIESNLKIMSALCSPPTNV